MPGKRLRQTQKQQIKQRLVNLAARGTADSDAIDETRTILRQYHCFHDPKACFGDKDDYPPWIIASRRSWTVMLRVYLDHFRSLNWDEQRITDLLDMEDPSGDSPLLAAAIGGCLTNVLDLLHAGATPTERMLTEAVKHGTNGVDLIVAEFIRAGVQLGHSPIEAAVLDTFERKLWFALDQLIQTNPVSLEFVPPKLLPKKSEGSLAHCLAWFWGGFSPNNGPAVVQKILDSLALKEIAAIVIAEQQWRVLDLLVQQNSAVLDLLVPVLKSRGDQGYFTRLLLYWQIQHMPPSGPAVFRHVLHIGSSDGEIFSYIDASARRGNNGVLIEILDYLKESNRQHQERAILALANAPDPACIDTLKTFVGGIDAKFQPNTGQYYCHCYSVNQGCDSALAIAVNHKELRNVELLLKHGASPNTKTRSGGTVLIDAACRRNNPCAILEALVDAGAALDAVGVGGATALHYAARQIYPDLGIMKVLQQKGANFLLKTASGHDALELCQYAQKTWEHLVGQKQRIECIPFLERYTALSSVFWNKCQTNPFRLLAETGVETSNGLLQHIGGYLSVD